MIHVQDAHGSNKAQHFRGNLIRTTKYTPLTFLPKNLFEQFNRVFNLFWLANSIVALIPGLSPISSSTTVAGLVFILAVSAIKEAAEDLARHRADRTENNSLCHKALNVTPSLPR